MTMLKLLCTGLATAALLASPAMAREHHSAKRAEYNPYAAASFKSADCVRAPRVGAFATQPWRKPPCEPAGY